jgi:aminopeptidase-like protein
MHKVSNNDSRKEVDEINRLLNELFPITRSLTGPGNRETLRILQDLVPLEIREYPCGSDVYDWVIPAEWVIKDAYIKNECGDRIVDFKKSNLHVVGYSTPIEEDLPFASLCPHLHKIDAEGEVIPYRTTYYNRDWGFCVTQSQYDQLAKSEGLLSVKIDSEFKEDGSMTVAELCIPGETTEEYLVSTYFCHPSMANDNLSGLLATAFLARDMLNAPRLRKSWRFVFVPETIGAIAYLNQNESEMMNLAGGLVVTNCGGPGQMGFKETFLSEHTVDKAICLAFREASIEPLRYPFVPDGSDERQYSSPAFRIPVASITKDKYYEYPEYHTSLDNLDFVTGSQIAESLVVYRRVLRILDSNQKFQSTQPFCEPHLGKRGMYPNVGGGINQTGSEPLADVESMMWILFLADGEHDLISISEKSGIRFAEIEFAADKLREVGLLDSADPQEVQES